MGKNNIFFFGGVHGVGKTTLCKKMSYKLSIQHFSSSELISMLDSSKVKNDKIVDDINSNQDVLLEAVEQFLSEDKIYLLDGHFCLMDGEYLIKQIPSYIFESLKIKGIIILVDSEKRILDRLIHRDKEYNHLYSLEFIQEFQKEEISYGKYIATQLGVPFRIIRQPYKELEIEMIIRKIINGKRFQ